VEGIYSVIRLVAAVSRTMAFGKAPPRHASLAIYGHGFASGSAHLAMSGTVPLPHLRGVSASFGHGVPKAIADMITHTASSARGGGWIAGTANMMASGQTTARSRITIFAALSLAARGVTTSFAKGIDRIAMVAKSIAIAMGALRFAARGALRGASSSQATDKSALSGDASMHAQGTGAGKGEAHATGTAEMSGASAAASMSNVRPRGLLGIVARGLTAAFSSVARPPAFYLLWARSIAAAFGRSWIFRPRKPVTPPSRGSSTAASTTLANTVSAPPRNNIAQDS
jgi:hypothetical protein